MINDGYFGAIEQVAYIVRDVDQAIVDWNKGMGVGAIWC